MDFRTGSKTSPVPFLFKFIVVRAALNSIKTSSSWLLIFTCTHSGPQYLELWSVPRGVGKERDRLRAYWSSPITEVGNCSPQAKSGYRLSVLLCFLLPVKQECIFPYLFIYWDYLTTKALRSMSLERKQDWTWCYQRHISQEKGSKVLL